MSLPVSSSLEAQLHAPARQGALRLAQAVRAHLKGEPTAALEALQTAAAEGSDTSETIAARAHLCLELKRYPEAAAEYEKLAAMDAGSAETYYQWGACLYQQGKFGPALERLQRSAELEPSRADVALMIGLTHLQLKRPEEALDAFNTCLEKQPTQESALLGKAVALQLSWELEESASVYELVLSRNPTSEDALVNMIALGMQRKDNASIRRWAAQLLRQNPTATVALEGLASASFAEGHYDEAAGHYGRLVELQPANYDYWFNLGVTNQRKGDLLEAATA